MLLLAHDILTLDYRIDEIFHFCRALFVLQKCFMEFVFITLQCIT